MSDRDLVLLAKEAGLAARWKDAAGEEKTVEPDTLRAVLKALSLPTESAAQIAESRAALREQKAAPPSLILATPGETLSFGETSVTLREELGYQEIESRRFAIVPAKAWSLADILPDQKSWAIAAQVYSLRNGTTPGFGDFTALGHLAEDAAAYGAQAVAMSPVHALFGAAPEHYGPYSPSTRLFLNPLYASLPGQSGPEGGEFIDWPAAGSQKMRALRQAFDAAWPQIGDVLQAFLQEEGPRLLAHARFEMLDARFRKQGIAGWRNWPEHYRNARSKTVASLSPDDPEIAFQVYLQWMARRSLTEAQDKARKAGMRVGLITDMAVGMDPSGSHAWEAPDEVLTGLSIGAPPDLFNHTGQNWGLTALSPLALLRSGFGGYIATLRASMASAGGIRLDHAMGLLRLWVIPEGASAKDGVYLQYPFDEMLSLLKLESQLHKAVVIAEDLGTVPEGFREKIAAAGLHGMRVLWFERDAKGTFLAPQDWDASAAALSTTHDLPTLTGWWRGRDLAWRRKIETGFDVPANRDARAKDREQLWTALIKAECAQGEQPPSGNATKLTDAAFSFLAQTPCPLAILPVEDFLGEAEQPNLPGTIDEHPNWCRRIEETRPLANRKAARRASLLNRGRGS